MLVLSRKVGEKLVVPQCQLTVTVVEITGSRVRLGVSAPLGLAVHREEVQKRILAEDVGIGGSLVSVRILIAEPDKYLLASYREDLCRRGAVVTMASNGLECLERLRKSSHDVLVLESALTWGGGDGVLALLNENPVIRPAFVILLSYGRDRSLLHRVSQFKVDDYQVKPLPSRRLAERIYTLVESRHSQDALTVRAAGETIVSS